MKSKMFLDHKLIAIVLFSLLTSVCTFAQTEEGDQEIQDTEVVIEKNRKIELNKETKLYEFIKWQPEHPEYKSNHEGKYEVFNYELSKEEEVYVPATTPTKGIEETYSQYLKAGFGNYNSPLLDINLVTPSDVDQVVRFNYKHLSFSKGEVDDNNSASSTNQLALNGTKIWDRVKTTLDVGYRSDVNYYFGYDQVGEAPDRSSIKKNNRFFDAGIVICDNYLDDDWTYELGVAYRQFDDNYSNSENTLDLTGDFKYLDNYHINAALAISDLNSAIDTRSYYRVNPYYRFEAVGINIDGGLSISGQSDDFGSLTKFKVFPYLSATYDLSEDYQAFFKLDGGYDFNTLYTFSDIVPYLNNITPVINTENRLVLNVGIRGNINDQWYTELKAGINSVRNLPVYTNNSIDQALLDIVYDNATTVISSIGITSEYYLDDVNDFLFSLDYKNYSGGDINPYHLPVLTLKLRGHHEFYEDWSLQWQYNLLSGITAYDAASDTAIDLEPIHQLDLGLHYQIQEKLGAFVSANNVIGKSYTRYYQYPQRKLQIKAGVTYRF